MKIKEIRVHRYGPLADFALNEPGDFTLLFGPNESGKTLLLDAILRFLLQRQRERTLFWDRARVEHEPNGFVAIQHGDQDLRFPDDGLLSDVLDIQAEDLRNILVVRASDLHVEQGKQKEYYAALTDRLMGIHREPMSKIIDKLLDIGRLTATRRDLSDSAEYDSIASRFNNAKSLLEEIDTLKAEFKTEDLIELERELIEAEEEHQEIEKELAILEQAKKRESYRAGQSLLDDLGECVAELDDLPDISQEDYDNWRDAEKETERASEAIEEAEAELEQLRDQLDQAKAEEEGARDHQRQLEAKQDSIQSLGDETRLYRKALEEEAGRSPLLKEAPRVLLGAFVLFVVALVAIAGTSDVPILRLMGAVAIVVLLGSGGLWIWAKRQEGIQERNWENLRLEAAQLGMEVHSAERLLQAVRQFSDDLEKAKDKRNEATNERVGIEDDIRSQQEVIDENERTIESAHQTLDQLRGELGVATLDELEAAREEADDLTSTRNKLATQLEERFGEAAGSIEEKMEVWREKIEQLAEFEDAAEDVEYDQARESQLESKLQDLGSRIEETRNELDDVRSQIGDIAQRANEVLRPEQGLPGDTLEDLDVLERELKAFADETDERAALARRAIEILEDIRADEEQKVKELFGEEDLASQYFRSITNNAYQRVDYEPESGELKVIRPNEEVLSAYKLSSGTYDQLYLATRLSLADRLLGGEPGFLLLDDPFLTSDSNRLERQLEILLDLAEEGWQIVYFSVKEEVANLLEPTLSEGLVRKEEMPQLG